MKEEIVNKIFNLLQKETLRGKIEFLKRGIPYGIINSLETDNVFDIIDTIERGERIIDELNNKDIMKMLFEELKTKLVYKRKRLIKSIDDELKESYADRKRGVIERLVKLNSEHIIDSDLTTELVNYIEEKYKY